MMITQRGSTYHHTAFSVLKVLLCITLGALFLYLTLFQPLTQTNINEDDFIAAIYSGKQSFESFPFNKGHIILIRKDGSTKTISHKGMDNGKIAWTSDGLFFADKDYDYHISSILHKSKSPKSDYQDFLITTDSEEIVGIYNKGFNEDLYDHEVIHHNQNSKPFIFNKYITSVASCADSIYAFTPYEKNSQERARTSLYKIFENNEFLDELVSRPAQIFEVTGFADDHQPCIDGKIYALTSHSTPDTITPPMEQLSGVEFTSLKIDLSNYILTRPHSLEIHTLEIWDTQERTRDVIPINFTDISPDYTPNELSTAKYIDYNRMNITWISKRGIIFETNTQDGYTKMIKDPIIPLSDDHYDIEIAKTNDSIYIFTDNMSYSAENSEILRLNRSNLSIVDRIKIENYSHKLDQSEVLRGFAVNPNLE